MRSHRIFKLIPLVFVMLFAVTHAYADSGNISVKSSLSNAFITIGEPVTYTVTLTYDENIHRISPLPTGDETIFKIKSVDDDKETEKGQIIETRTMVFTTFRLGEFVVDPVTIEFKMPDGNVKAVETDKLYVTVKSVAEGEEKTDIRGFKDVVDIDSKALQYLLFAGGGVLLLAFAWLLYKKFGSKSGAGYQDVRIRSAEEIALERLNKLTDSDLLRRNQVKEYFLTLSEILRIYFEHRFQILAVESTTDETLRNLKQKNIDAGLFQKIREVLETSDLAKFAKFKPDPLDIRKINQKSREIIEEAAPKPRVEETENAV